MKNKKIKTVLIAFIMLLIIVLCFNVGVYAAYALAATDVSYTKPNGTQTSVKAALDEVYAKVPSHEIGDEVTVGGEQFYVLEWDNNCDTVNLMSKYVLNSDATWQSTTLIECRFYENTKFWNNNNFTSSVFNINDVIGYTEADAIGKAKKYGRSKGAVASRLPTDDEFEPAYSKFNSNSKINAMWAAQGQNFWLGSVTKNDDAPIFIRFTGGNHTDAYGFSIAGVRPVITVSKSAIQ